MELKVYDWEQFERWKVRYLIFTLIISWAILLSVLSSNIFWWVIILLVVGWYIYYLTKSNDTISMVAWKNALQIDKKAYPWNSLQWFVLEYHTEKKKIHNIVIITADKEAKIYTINDKEENIEEFANEINWYIPLLDNYNQSTLDRFIRKIKL